MRKGSWNLFLFVALPLLLGAADGSLTVTYVANGGFLLEGGGKKVAIDAIFESDRDAYVSPTPEMVEEIGQAGGRFAGVDLALVSHHHWDHFTAATMARFLAASPETCFVSSKQVTGELVAAAGDGELEPRVIGHTPEFGEVKRYELCGVTVDVMRMHHGLGSTHIQNLGHIIHVGGKKVLHVGDAEVAPEIYAPYRLHEKGIDVALIPYWILTGSKGDRAVELIGARQLVAVHVPAAELAEVARTLRELHPGAVLFREQGEPRDF